MIQRIFIVAALILVYKIAEIQLFDSSYRQQAQNTTLEQKTLYPSRGLIYDRNGELMVYNNPMYDIKVVFNQVNPAMNVSKFCSLLGITKSEYDERINKDWSNYLYSRAVPFTFMRNVPAEMCASFEESMFEFPGFYLTLRNVRGYRYPMAAHILGYISEVDRDKIDASEGFYSQGDYIGTTGIELRYENDLRGTKGTSYVLKDNLGREVEKLDEGRLDSAAVSGRDIVLSIDRTLQQYAESLLGGKMGSVVCIEPATGDILAMASSPNYDPSLLTIRRDRGIAYERLQNDTLKPFFNRSVMAEYPPGSIFKPILSLIALQEGILTPNRTIYCDGAYHYRHFSYGCHDHPTARSVASAIQLSCNSYFYQVFRDFVEMDGFSLPEIGLKKLNAHLAEFGLGHKISLDIQTEKRGNIPPPELYNDMYGAGTWRSTYIMSLGIGQGEMQLTTLQMANLAAIIANRGYYVPPHLLKAYKNQNGIESLVQSEKKYVQIDQQHFDPVIEGMSRAVKMGTATIGDHPDIEICGKTGTSENAGKDHSVFFAFAPRENPQIAVAVFIENGGWGATYAVPIGSLVIEKYLTGDILQNRKWLEKRMQESQTILP